MMREASPTCQRMLYHRLHRGRCGEPATHLVWYEGTDGTGEPISDVLRSPVAMCKRCLRLVTPLDANMTVVSRANPTEEVDAE